MAKQTFFIIDAKDRSPGKPARACNSCYDTVFPLIGSPTSDGGSTPNQDVSTLSSFPSWTTQKGSPLEVSKPSELMAIEPKSGSPRKDEVGVIRKRKSRPMSHPVIPQVFGDALSESPLDPSFRGSSKEGSEEALGGAVNFREGRCSGRDQLWAVREDVRAAADAAPYRESARSRHDGIPGSPDGAPCAVSH